MKTVTMMLNEHLITLSPLEIGMLYRKINHSLATNCKDHCYNQTNAPYSGAYTPVQLSVLIDSYVVKALRFLSTALFSQGHIYRGRGGAGE